MSETYEYVRSLVNGQWDCPNNPFHLDETTNIPIPLSKEIETAFPGEPFSITADGEVMHVIFESVVSDEAALDALVAAHKSDVDYLTAAKLGKIIQIINRTQELIDTGVFAYSGKVFSLDPKARTQYLTMNMFKDRLPSTVRLITADGLDFLEVSMALYPVTDNVKPFVEAAVDAAITIAEAGNDLIESVQEASTVEEVAAVVDDR